jgi:hypothetical protein
VNEKACFNSKGFNNPVALYVEAIAYTSQKTIASRKGALLPASAPF